jgi:hypothetical protein
MLNSAGDNLDYLKNVKYKKMKIHSFIAVFALGRAKKSRDPEKHLHHIVKQTTNLVC